MRPSEFVTVASRGWSAVLILAIAGMAPSIALAKQSREDKVRADKARVEAEGFWIYNDLPRAFSEARSTDKPMIVVFRCIPCVECVKLDDEILNEDPELHALLDQFVRVRVVSTNGLDLSLFRFDYDQSFAVFFLNADGTVYGRFGTRSHRTEWADDVSVAGLKQALIAALTLHANYPANQTDLRGKHGTSHFFRQNPAETAGSLLSIAVPEEFPSLTKYKSSLDYDGNVVQSCIHCHQIGDAIKELELTSDHGISAEALFPFPHPKSLGLILDPKQCATVTEVQPNSPADHSGFLEGDVITAISGQPILSIADVQWILHGQHDEEAKIEVDIVRGKKELEIELQLPKGWRELDDISWRASSWELRRWALGGMQLQAAITRPAGVPAERMALEIKHVGQYHPHDVAKNAGFLPGDTIVSFDGRKDLFRETDLLAYALRGKSFQRDVAVEIIRAGKRLEMVLPAHESSR